MHTKNRRRNRLDHLEDRIEESFWAKAAIIIAAAGLLVVALQHSLQTMVFHQSVSTGEIVAVERDGKLVKFQSWMEDEPYRTIPVK